MLVDGRQGGSGGRGKEASRVVTAAVVADFLAQDPIPSKHLGSMLFVV